MFSLEGRLAVVTGAGRGIGRGIADAFADAGAKVVLTDVNDAELAAAVAAIETRGGQAEGRKLDVSDAAA